MSNTATERSYGPESVVGASIALALVVTATTYLLALTVFVIPVAIALALLGVFIGGSPRRLAVGFLTGALSAVPTALVLIFVG